MGIHHDAELVLGVVIVDFEEDGPDPYEWTDLPDCLDFASFGDSSQDWGGYVLHVKSLKVRSGEVGYTKFDLREFARTAFAWWDDDNLDEVEEVIAWCDEHGIDFRQADGMLIASRG